MQWRSSKGTDALEDLKEPLLEAVNAGLRLFQNASTFSDTENDVLLQLMALQRLVAELRPDRKAGAKRRGGKS